MPVKKVLIVSSFTIPIPSGSGTHAFRLAQYLNKKGYHCSILTFNRNLRYRSSAFIQGVRIIRIPYFNRGAILKLLSFPFIIFYYCFLTLKNKVIIIYGSKIYGFQILILLSKLFNRITIFQSLLFNVDDLDTLVLSHNGIKKRLNFWFFNNITIYHSINPEFSNLYRQCNFSKAKLLDTPQGVDIMNFKPVSKKEKINLRTKYGISTDRFVIICPATLIKRKGFEELFVTLGNIKLNFLFLIVGQHKPINNFLSNQQNDEMKLLYALGKQFLQDKVKYIDYTLQINELLQLSDILILNSTLEGTPNVILEGMASGLPILCRKLRGLNNTLQHFNNALIYQNTKEMEEFITLLYNDGQFRNEISLRARKFAEMNLSFDLVVEKLFKLI